MPLDAFEVPNGCYYLPLAALWAEKEVAKALISGQKLFSSCPEAPPLLYFFPELFCFIRAGYPGFSLLLFRDRPAGYELLKACMARCFAESPRTGPGDYFAS